MAEVKVVLEPGETVEDAQEALLKAMTIRLEDPDHRPSFRQPASQEVVDKMVELHTEALKRIAQGIKKELQ